MSNGKHFNNSSVIIEEDLAPPRILCLATVIINFLPLIAIGQISPGQTANQGLVFVKQTSNDINNSYLKNYSKYNPSQLIS